MEETPFYRAIVLDLDGVVTDTRGHHFHAWKSTFDDYLLKLKPQKEFSLDDYEKYVDGKPRRQGIRVFLNSRLIPFNESDVEMIARKKNDFYLQNLRNGKLNIFEDAKKLIDELKQQSISFAIVSSSENCREILKKLNLLEMPEAIVDGTDGLKLKLKGKPAPDFFIEALKRLGLKGNECIAVEDSSSGITACKNAHFKKVFGLARNNHDSTKLLKEAGADIVIKSLDEIK